MAPPSTPTLRVPGGARWGRRQAALWRQQLRPQTGLRLVLSSVKSFFLTSYSQRFLRVCVVDFSSGLDAVASGPTYTVSVSMS